MSEGVPDPVAAHDAFAQRWRRLEPALAWARSFGTPADEAPLLLAAELTEALYALSERQVAEAKLGWWVEECERARSGGGAHPLLPGLTAAGAVPDPVALESVLAEVLDGAPAVSAEAHAEQALALARVLHPAPAVAELLALWSQWLRLRLIHRAADYAAPALPLLLLAEVQLKPDALREDSPARRRAIAMQAGALGARVGALAGLPPLGAALAAQLAADARTLAQAPARPEQLPTRPLARLWTAWRGARRGTG
jgi:phytoene synthase